MDSNPICHPSPARKMKCSFLDYVHFWWSAGLVDGLEPHLPLLSSQKYEMLTLGLCSTSDEQPGWSMDLNPICHPSPAKIMKCSFLDYIQLLMIGWDGRWAQTPSTTPHQPKKQNPCFWIMFNFWWSARLVNGLKPHAAPLSSQKNGMLIFGLCSLLMIGWAGWWTWTPSTTPLQPEIWNAHFWITFNLWCWPGWLMDLNPIHHPSPAKKMKGSFWDYAQLLMISLGWSMVSNPFHHAFFSQKNKILASLDYVQLLMISQAGRMDSNPICHISPAKKMKCSFLDYVQLLIISLAGWWAHTPSATPLQPGKWNAHL